MPQGYSLRDLTGYWAEPGPEQGVFDPTRDTYHSFSSFYLSILLFFSYKITNNSINYCSFHMKNEPRHEIHLYNSNYTLKIRHQSIKTTEQVFNFDSLGHRNNPVFVKSENYQRIDLTHSSVSSSTILIII